MPACVACLSYMPAVPDSAVARLLAAPACLLYIYPFAFPDVPSCSTCLRSLLATPTCVQCLLAATTCWRYLLAVLARRTDLSYMPAVPASVPDCDASACLPVVPVMPVVSPGSVHAPACHACLLAVTTYSTCLLYAYLLAAPTCIARPLCLLAVHLGSLLTVLCQIAVSTYLVYYLQRLAVVPLCLPASCRAAMPVCLSACSAVSIDRV